MLSFDPAKPFADVNLGLSDSFNAQTEQAQQSELMTKEQLQQLQSLIDPSTNLALMSRQAQVAGDTPGLKFGFSSSNPASMLAEGIGGGINNYYAMKGHRQQQQMYQDIIAQNQRAQAEKRDLLMGQINAQARQDQDQLDYIGKTRPDLLPLARVANREQRAAMMTKEIGLGYAPAEGTAEGQKQVSKGQAVNTAVSQMPPVERNGIPIPAQVDARHNIQGYAPTTTVDVNRDVIANKKSMVDLKQGENQLSVQPTQLQQDIELKKLQIAQQVVEAQFAEQEKQLKIKRDQLANKQGSLDYKKGLEEYKRFEQGQRLFNQFKEDGSLQSNDPIKQAQMQAQLGLYGVKYNPPNASYQTIKRKDGSIYMLDKTSGQIGKLEQDGTVKTWQDLQF